LDSLLDPKHAFIFKDVAQTTAFFNEMRTIKRLILEQAVASAEFFSKFKPSDQAETGTGKRKECEDADVDSDVAETLSAFRDRFLAQPVSRDGDPVDDATCDGRMDDDEDDALMILQRLAVNFPSKWAHQPDPCDAVNFLDFVTSGRRVKLIGTLSQMILQVEKALPKPPPKETKQGSVGINKVLYSKKTEEFTEKQCGVQVTFLPWLKPGPRFVRYDQRSAMIRLPTTDKLRAEFNDRKKALDARPANKIESAEDDEEDDDPVVDGLRSDDSEQAGDVGGVGENQKGEKKGKKDASEPKRESGRGKKFRDRVSGEAEQEKAQKDPDKKGRAQVRREGRESEWGRMFFKEEIIDRPKKSGYFMSSFSSDGSPISLSLSDCPTVFV
jgi:hypothetical protein